MSQNQDGSINTGDGRPDKRFTVKAEIEFAVRAKSLNGAYNEFQRFITDIWNDALSNGNTDPIVSIRDFHGTQIKLERSGHAE